MMKCLPCQPHIFNPNQKASVMEANFIQFTLFCKAFFSSLLLLMIDFTSLIRTILLGLILKLLKLHMFRVEVDLRHKRAFEDMHFSFAFLVSILHCSIDFFRIAFESGFQFVNPAVIFRNSYHVMESVISHQHPFFYQLSHPFREEALHLFHLQCEHIE